MCFVLARKHAARLRVIALILFAVLPVALAVPALALHSPLLIALYAVTAALGATAGTFVERWLFFAEAKHVVMLYYERGLRDEG
jgi:DMSO reductase anchor subunit